MRVQQCVRFARSLSIILATNGLIHWPWITWDTMSLWENPVVDEKMLSFFVLFLQCLVYGLKTIELRLVEGTDCFNFIRILVF